MSNRKLMLDLAKLVISAAWADGELCSDEINALKDLLFNMDAVTAEDWEALEMYMERPPREDEKTALLEGVLNSIRTSKDKTFVINTLETLFSCDGQVTREEAALLEQLKMEISEVPTNIFSSLSKAFSSAISRRNEKVQATCLREHNSDDYIHNTIYYDLTRKLENSSTTIDKSEAELRKLCLATGLLAHVANVDNLIEDEEKQAMCSILAEDWGLTKREAELFVSLGCDRTTRGLDYFRLSYGYFTCTNIDERRNFLKTLFRTANAARGTDNDEIEEIRLIAKSLKLSHKDFIDAKLTIPREDRKGL